MNKKHPKFYYDNLLMSADPLLLSKQDRKKKEKLIKEKEFRESQMDLSLWFGLSYAQFLTVPRLVLESMPREWQQKMASLLFEIDETFDWRPKGGRYWVRLKDSKGRFTDAPLSNYRRGWEEIERLRKKAQPPRPARACSIGPMRSMEPGGIGYFRGSTGRLKKE